MIAKKLIRDGKVAVLYSRGYGAGWYSWNTGISQCLFEPEIVEAVEAGDRDRAVEIAERMWPDGYWGGADGLQIEWLPVGTRFEISEYDGAESVRVLGPADGFVA